MSITRNPATVDQLLDQLIDGAAPFDLTDLVYPEVVELKQRLFEKSQYIYDENGNVKLAATPDLIMEVKAIEKTIQSKKLSYRQLLIGICEYLIQYTATKGCGICMQNGYTYVYNGTFWQCLNAEQTKTFLMKFGLKIGLDEYDIKYFKLLKDLYEQFCVLSTSAAPSGSLNTNVLINVQNGTLEITPTGILPLKAFDRNDFLKYRLNFDYNPDASAPLFHSFLNKVLPDNDCQSVLAEYLGYVFLKNGVLKLEKILVLYGKGANGKSVIYDIIKALLGPENISSHSPSLLMSQDRGARYRAEIADKLLNYSSEMGGDFNSDMFKKIASGETIDACPVYKQPYEISQYAKMMLNTNDLPQAHEVIEAYYRRLLIIPFDVTIPEEERDINLANKIIENELSGVLNWVLSGLNRLLTNGKFTHSAVCEGVLQKYRVQSDSVLLFLETDGYEKSTTDTMHLSEFYKQYRSFCREDGYIPLSNKKVADRLRQAGYEEVKDRHGLKFYLEKDKYLKFSPNHNRELETM